MVELQIQLDEVREKYKAIARSTNAKAHNKKMQTLEYNLGQLNEVVRSVRRFPPLPPARADLQPYVFSWFSRTPRSRRIKTPPIASWTSARSESSTWSASLPREKISSVPRSWSTSGLRETCVTNCPMRRRETRVYAAGDLALAALRYLSAAAAEAMSRSQQACQADTQACRLARARAILPEKRFRVSRATTGGAPVLTKDVLAGKRPSWFFGQKS